MDLTRYSPKKAAEKGAVLHLCDPATNEPLYDNGEAVTITILGAESSALKDKAKEIERRRTEGEDIDAAQAGFEMLAVGTIAWTCISLHGDEPLECNYENALKVYTDPDADWIAEQAVPFSRARKNFIANRAKS